MSLGKFTSWRKITAFFLITLLAATIVHGQGTESASDSARIAAVKAKLRSIVIEKVNFDKADVGTVLQFLSQKSKELDPEKQGINFVLQTAPAGATTTPPPRTVSLTLDRISLADLLHEITQQTGMEYSVDAFAVFVRPVSNGAEAMTLRTFAVPPGFFDPAVPDDTNLTTAMSAQKYLETKGILFPPGSTATFLPQANKLVVRNTPQQLDLIAKLLGS